MENNLKCCNKGTKINHDSNDNKSNCHSLSLCPSSLTTFPIPQAPSLPFPIRPPEALRLSLLSLSLDCPTHLLTCSRFSHQPYSYLASPTHLLTFFHFPDLPCRYLTGPFPLTPCQFVRVAMLVSCLVLFVCKLLLPECLPGPAPIYLPACLPTWSCL